MDEDHLRRLRYDTASWNGWRQANPGVRPDLSGAQINWHTSKSTLGRTRSVFRQFQDHHLRGIDLRDADVRASKIVMCDLSDADLSGADLRGAEIRLTNLARANLRGADLRDTQFIRSDLPEAHLERAICGGTHFGYATLRGCSGIEEIVHRTPSSADQFTLVHSAPLPASFYDACQVPAHVVRMAEVFAGQHPYKTCFLSYSRRDELIVQYLREVLTWYGVPSWFAPLDMRDTSHQEDETELERDLFTYIDEAEIVLLAISPHILNSSWVGKELARARASKPVLALLLETMPTPDSEQWISSIAATQPKHKHSHFVPHVYSGEIEALLARPLIDLRQWRDPAAIAQILPGLLTVLRNPASTAPPP